jgi:hypothetical protein
MIHIPLSEQVEHRLGHLVEREDRAGGHQVDEAVLGSLEFVQFAAPIALVQHDGHCDTSG